MQDDPTNPAESETDHGAVPVDSGQILIVDPCHLPPEVYAALTAPNEYGITAATVVQTPMGDGLYPVLGESGALVILDPYADEDGNGGPWGAITDGYQ